MVCACGEGQQLTACHEWLGGLQWYGMPYACGSSGTCRGDMRFKAVRAGLGESGQRATWKVEHETETIVAK